MNEQNNFSHCLEPTITSKQYKYKIITSFTDVLYTFLLQNAVNISCHFYSQMIKKSAFHHTVSTPSVFTAFRILFAWTQQIHAFYHILFVYMRVIQVPTGTLLYAVHSDVLFTSSLSIRSWCSLHFSCCVYKPDTHVLSTSLCLLAADIHKSSILPYLKGSWYTSFFLIFLFIRGYSYILSYSGVSVLSRQTCFIPLVVLYKADTDIFPLILFVYTQLIHTFFTLWFCLYTADSYILSTFAVFIRSWYICLILLVVSIRNWGAPFFPLAPIRSW
jgi:hypothetical protein